MLFSKDPKTKEKIRRLTQCVHFMNSEHKFDFRQLNLMRTTLLKEYEDNSFMTEDRFVSAVE